MSVVIGVSKINTRQFTSKIATYFVVCGMGVGVIVTVFELPPLHAVTHQSTSVLSTAVMPRAIPV